MTLEWLYAVGAVVVLVLIVIARLRPSSVRVPAFALVGMVVTTAGLTILGFLQLLTHGDLSDTSVTLWVVATGSLSASAVLTTMMLVSRLRDKEAQQPAG